MPQVNKMQDKDIMQDVLSSQKLATSNYNTFSTECASPRLRRDVQKILREEHDIQAGLFTEMNTRGWYPVAPADQQKITDAKTKFQGMKM